MDQAQVQQQADGTQAQQAVPDTAQQAQQAQADQAVAQADQAGQQSDGSQQAQASGDAAQQAFEARKYLAERLGQPALATAFADDKQLLDQVARVMQALPQMQQAAQLGAMYQQHAEQFQKYLTSQQQAAQQQQQAQQTGGESPWQAPEYDPSWESAIEVDEKTGEVRVKAGRDPLILGKLEKYREFQREVFNKLTRDPIGALKPGLEKVVKSVVEEAVAKHLGGFQQTQTAQGFVQENRDWLFVLDADRRPVSDPLTGRPMLSPAGRRFEAYVEQLDKAGVTNVLVAQELAKKAVLGDLWQLQKDQQKVAPQQPPAKVVPPQPGGGLSHLAAGGGQGPAGTLGLSLKDRLRAELDRAGITDEKFRLMAN